MTLSLASLLVQETKAAIYATALGVANAVGLPVSSWQAGDPTRSLFYAEAETLSTLEEVVIGFISSGFLEHASGTWLKIVAEQFYGVIVPAASYATTTVTLTNPGGGLYDGIAAGDLTFKCSITGKTYTNTSGGTLASGPGTTLDVDVIADEAGSDSSAGAGEIDELVTSLGSVTCSNATAAVGVDEQDEETTKQQCRDRRARMSTHAPKGALVDVALDSDLTLTSNITRARSYGSSDTGDATLYLAGPSGAVAEVDRALVETAILDNATPLCVTPSVLSVVNVDVPVIYSIWLYKRCGKTGPEAEAEIETALEDMFAIRPIGGDIIEPDATGSMYLSLIESTIREVFSADAFRIVVWLPTGDTALANGEVAALGTVTGTITLVNNP